MIRTPLRLVMVPGTMVSSIADSLPKVRPRLSHLRVNRRGPCHIFPQNITIDISYGGVGFFDMASGLGAWNPPRVAEWAPE